MTQKFHKQIKKPTKIQKKEKKYEINQAKEKRKQKKRLYR